MHIDLNTPEKTSHLNTLAVSIKGKLGENKSVINCWTINK